MTIITDVQNRLAARSTGVEQEIIELVARRRMFSGAQSALDTEIGALHDELARLGEAVAGA